VHIHGLTVGRAARAEQRINEPGQAICLADDDVGVLGQSLAAKLPCQELCRSPYPAEWILYLVRQLPDHLPACTVLYQERILAADPVASRHVGKLDEQYR